MKTCFKCKKPKPLTAFYKHKAMSDGVLGKCKECTKADVKANYSAKRSQYADYERERYQRPERRAAALEYQRTRRKKYPGKTRAVNAVSNAIRDGRLTREPCEVCGAKKVQAHHDDYRKPLAIRWLCRKHHLEHHGKKAY